MEAFRSGPALRLAAVRIGTIDVGISAGAVLQALPATRALPAPPRRSGALCAVVEHDGRLLPVVDLARWIDVGCGADDAPGQARVVLLRDGGRRIGLRVDAVNGLVDAGEPARLHRDDDPDEVFHSVATVRDSGKVLTMLDVERLAALALAWHDEADGTAAVSAEAAAGAAVRTTVQYALMRHGGVRLAVPAADVAEVLPMPHVERSGFGLAYAVWRGRHVPLLPARLLDDAAADAARVPALLAVIEHGGLALGLPVDAALGMAPFAPDHDGLPAMEGIALSAHDADGAVLLLDSGRLLARFPEAALSRPDGADAHARTRAGGRRNPTTHIVFEADGLASTPIDAVEQVLPLAQTGDGALAAGTLAWRGRTIALSDLRPAGRGADADGHVMVVRRRAEAGGHAGEARYGAFVVTRVHLLIPPHGGALYRMGAGPRAAEFICVGDGTGQASYRTVDLAG
jgi:chemotaxis signal transduction protein